MTLDNEKPYIFLADLLSKFYQADAWVQAVMCVAVSASIAILAYYLFRSVQSITFIWRKDTDLRQALQIMQQLRTELRQQQNQILEEMEKGERG